MKTTLSWLAALLLAFVLHSTASAFDPFSSLCAKWRAHKSQGHVDPCVGCQPGANAFTGSAPAAACSPYMPPAPYGGVGLGFNTGAQYRSHTFARSPRDFFMID